MSNDANSAPKKTVTEARQAEASGRGRWVLRISLGLAVLAMIVVLAIYM